jgi:P27 family predicted phage terminase small subunit
MRKGRPPHPLGLRLLRGNPGKRPIPANTPRPKAQAPARPRYLKGTARAWWDQTVPQLVRCGIVAPIDRTALEVCAVTFGFWREMCDAIADAGGPVYTSRTIAGEVVYRVRPEAALRARAARDLLSMLADFGCTPAGRLKVGTLPPPDDDDGTGWTPGRK